MSAQTKKNETQMQRAGLRLPVKPSTVAAAALAGCTLVEGCTGSIPQVRGGPPAITCPQGWKETHKRFGIDRDEKIATVKGYKGEPGEMARVKEGSAVLEVRVPTSFGEVGELPEKTLLLGTWVVGLEDHTPYKNESGNIIDCPPGLGSCLASESKPDNAKTPSRIFLVRPTGQP